MKLGVRTDMVLNCHVNGTVERAKLAVADAGDITKERLRDHMRTHEEMMVSSHDHTAEASRLCK
jgi:hypothetical protein